MDQREDDPGWDDGLGPGADVDPLMIARAGIFAAAVNPQARQLPLCTYSVASVFRTKVPASSDPLQRLLSVVR